jgi:UDP-N-acetylglucosamine acyltransferase
VITKDALPFAKTVGLKPACYGLNRIGMQRKGMTDETMRDLERAVRILTRSGLNTQQALEELRGSLHGADIEYLVDFIETSERGFVKSKPGQRGERGHNAD